MALGKIDPSFVPPPPLAFRLAAAGGFGGRPPEPPEGRMLATAIPQALRYQGLTNLIEDIDAYFALNRQEQHIGITMGIGRERYYDIINGRTPITPGDATAFAGFLRMRDPADYLIGVSEASPPRPLPERSGIVLQFKPKLEAN